MIPGDDETVSEIDDAALFAMASAAAPEEVEQETPVQAEPEPAKEPEKQPEGEPAKPAAQETEHRVPLRELLDTRDALKEERRQRQELQQRLQAIEAQQKPVDIFTDPQAYQETIEQRFERQQREFDQRMRLHSINTSFSFAARQHGEDFQKAFAALEDVAAPHKGGDTMLRDRIVNSPDPGEAVMQWYQLLQETGGDLNGYRERLLQQERDRLAKDPEFRKRVIEDLRAEAASRPPVTQMPSLNRVPAAASNAGDEDRELGDAELFNYATSRSRRR